MAATQIKCLFTNPFITAMQFAMAQMEGKPDAARVNGLPVVVAIFVKLLGNPLTDVYRVIDQ